MECEGLRETGQTQEREPVKQNLLFFSLLLPETPASAIVADAHKECQTFNPRRAMLFLG
jgi:hypothetical protein